MPHPVENQVPLVVAEGAGDRRGEFPQPGERERLRTNEHGFQPDLQIMHRLPIWEKAGQDPRILPQRSFHM